MDMLIESSIEMTEKINKEHSLVVDANMIVEMLEQTLEDEKCGLAEAIRLVFRRITNFDYDNPTLPVQVSPPRYNRKEYSNDSSSENSYSSVQDNNEKIEGSISPLRERISEESSYRYPVSTEQDVEKKSSVDTLRDECRLSEENNTYSGLPKQEINEKNDHVARPMKRSLSPESDNRSSSSDQDVDEGIDISGMVNMDSVWETDISVPQKVRKTNLNKTDMTGEFERCIRNPAVIGIGQRRNAPVIGIGQRTPEMLGTLNPLLLPYRHRGLPFANIRHLGNVNSIAGFVPHNHFDSRYRNPCDIFPPERRRNQTGDSIPGKNLNILGSIRGPFESLDSMKKEEKNKYSLSSMNENRNLAFREPYFSPATVTIGKPENNNFAWNLSQDNTPARVLKDESSVYIPLQPVTPNGNSIFDEPLNLDIRTPKTHTRSSTVTLNTLQNENYDDVKFQNEDETDSSKMDGSNKQLNIAQSDDVAPLVDGVSNEEMEMNDTPWHKYLGRLIAMFPDADTVYLNKKCLEADNESLELHDVIDILLRDGYPLRKKKEELKEENKKNLSWEELSNYLTEVLPNADPSYLEQECEKLAGDQEQLLQFVADRLERKDYPRKEEYLKRLEIERKVKMYKENFSVEEFLKIFPDPITYFYEEKKTGYTHREHSLAYLRKKLRDVRCSDIRLALTNFSSNLTKTYHDLMTKRIEKLHFKMKCPRSSGFTHMPTECSIPFYQEVAFIEHEDVIKEYLNKRKKDKELAFNTAKENGELLECGVCFDNEVLPSDASTCTEGHIFCNSCIKTGVETDIGTGKTTFICFESECSGEFDLKILQLVLDAVVFSRMLLRRQAEEVKAAGIEDLEGCPFCEFCTIPDPEDKVFKCLNPACLKESCRKCREPNHVPLRCEEIEKPQDVKARTYIEDKMTQALVRECWKCHQKFIKEDGCNKMTCRCGAKMCYLCRQPVKDYTHFNGQGGSEYQKCPLYSDNKVLHVDAVKEAGKLAKEEIVNENPNVNIRHDPTDIFPTKTAMDSLAIAHQEYHNLYNNIVAYVHHGEGRNPPIRRRQRRN